MKGGHNRKDPRNNKFRGSFGAGGRTRTGTVSPPVDFESTTSANSITPAYLLHSFRLVSIPKGLGKTGGENKQIYQIYLVIKSGAATGPVPILIHTQNKITQNDESVVSAIPTHQYTNWFYSNETSFERIGWNSFEPYTVSTKPTVSEICWWGRQNRLFYLQSTAPLLWRFCFAVNLGLK